MSETTILFIVFADLTAGFLIFLFLKDYFNRFNWWKAALIKSCVYCLFFGIGAFGSGGGEPGFMLPAPILPGAIVLLAESNWYEFAQNVLLPYGFWVMVLFSFYCLRQLAIHLRKTRPFNR